MCSHFNRNPKQPFALPPGCRICRKRPPTESRLKKINHIFVDFLATKLLDNKSVTNPSGRQRSPLIGAVQENRGGTAPGWGTVDR